MSLGEAGARAVLGKALAAATGDEAEAVLLEEESALTRFAENFIHQNVAQVDASLRVRVVRDGRIGVASTNDLTDDGIRAAAVRAGDLAALQPRRESWPGLPGPTAYEPMPEADVATWECPPQARADRVRPLCETASRAGAIASGALSTMREAFAVANSHGVECYGERSRATWVAVVTHDEGSGYSEWVGTSIGDLDHEALGREALEKASASRNPIAVPAGEYPVVLEPYAVASLVSFLGHLGFSGQSVVEGRSFLTERHGETVAAERVNLADDTFDPRVVPLTFDFEGVPRRRVEHLVDGTAQAAVWDRETAARATALGAGGGSPTEPVASTGHALPAPNTWGPISMHLVMGSGETPMSELARGIQRGLWVTRFNYVRTVHPRETVLTGLTRDGTFLIEDGRRGPPVRNLRFTQSILGALMGVEDISAEAYATGGGGLGATVTPAVRMKGFRFTGVTTY